MKDGSHPKGTRQGAGSRVASFRSYAIFACVFATRFASAASGSTFSFDDIRYWVGSGANRAAMVIDWGENAADPPALVWGYRWDGQATGADMLSDVLAADDRLFAKLGGSLANPTAVYGLGYDADDDGTFTLDDGTTFNAAGIAITGAADLAIATDAGDFYAEGWYTGFWHYGSASSNPFDGDSWADAPKGIAGRDLTDGGWDSWTFSPTFNFSSFAVNPQAAPSPFPPGDYDQNGSVGMSDYLRWKERYGSHDPAADGNGNGLVDAADYTIWRNTFSMGAGAVSSEWHMVPEPTTALLAVVVVMFHALAAQRLLTDHR